MHKAAFSKLEIVMSSQLTKMSYSRVGEMTQQLKALAALQSTGVQFLTPTWQLTTVYTTCS
ncbi:hypothetical protein ACQP3L_32315, partial [Escherichia coli]